MKELNLAIRSSVVNYDVIIFTETWLREDIGDTELLPNNYALYRRDRNVDSNCKRGGGVLIAIKNNLSSRMIEPIYSGIEQLFVEVKLPNEVIILGTIYIPPKTSADASTETYLSFGNELLDLRSKYPNARILVAGDFNLPTLNWKEIPYLRPSTEAGYDATASEFLVNSIDVVNLFQCNFNVNNSGSILDLVFYDNQNIDIQVSVDPLIKCDDYHPALYFDIPAFGLQLAPIEVVDQYDFMRCDCESIIYYMNDVNWMHLFADSDLNLCVDKFHDILYTIIDCFVPKRRVSTTTYPEWFTAELRHLTALKKIAHIAYKKSPTALLYDKFSTLRSQCKNLSSNLYREYISGVESRIPNNMKSF